jgi:hypothetical protein
MGQPEKLGFPVRETTVLYWILEGARRSAQTLLDGMTEAELLSFEGNADALAEMIRDTIDRKRKEQKRNE